MLQLPTSAPLDANQKPTYCTKPTMPALAVFAIRRRQQRPDHLSPFIIQKVEVGDGISLQEVNTHTEHTQISMRNTGRRARGSNNKTAVLLAHSDVHNTLLSRQPLAAPLSACITTSSCITPPIWSPHHTVVTTPSHQLTVSNASTASPRACRCFCRPGGSCRILLPHPIMTTSGGGSIRSSSARLSGVMSLKPLTSHNSQVSGRHRMGPSTLTVLTTKELGRYL